MSTINYSLFFDQNFTPAECSTFKSLLENMAREIRHLKTQVDVQAIEIAQLKAQNHKEKLENSIEKGLIGNASDEQENSRIEIDHKIPSVRVADPFYSVTNLTKFDGNPTMPFSKWIGSFLDTLKLIPNLDEDQKIDRLEISLSGLAREKFKALPSPPEGTNKTLNWVIEQLKPFLENSSSKVLAKQRLSIARQAVGESVHSFATRLHEIIRMALVGESEAVICARMFDEFLDRLRPDLQLKVREHRPTDYANSYELAEHFELLRPMSSDKIASAHVEAMNLVDHRSNRSARRCYYCNELGHVVKSCPEKAKNKTRKSRHRDGYFHNYSPSRYRHHYSPSEDHRRRRGSPDYRETYHNPSYCRQYNSYPSRDRFVNYRSPTPPYHRKHNRYSQKTEFTRYRHRSESSSDESTPPIRFYDPEPYRHKDESRNRTSSSRYPHIFSMRLPKEQGQKFVSVISKPKIYGERLRFLHNGTFGTMYTEKVNYCKQFGFIKKNYVQINFKESPTFYPTVVFGIGCIDKGGTVEKSDLMPKGKFVYKKFVVDKNDKIYNFCTENIINMPKISSPNQHQTTGWMKQRGPCRVTIQNDFYCKNKLLKCAQTLRYTIAFCHFQNLIKKIKVETIFRNLNLKGSLLFNVEAHQEFYAHLMKRKIWKKESIVKAVMYIIFRIKRLRNVFFIESFGDYIRLESCEEILRGTMLLEYICGREIWEEGAYTESIIVITWRLKKPLDFIFIDFVVCYIKIQNSIGTLHDQILSKYSTTKADYIGSDIKTQKVHVHLIYWQNFNNKFTINIKIHQLIWKNGIFALQNSDLLHNLFYKKKGYFESIKGLQNEMDELKRCQLEMLSFHSKELKTLKVLFQKFAHPVTVPHWKLSISNLNCGLEEIRIICQTLSYFFKSLSLLDEPYLFQNKTKKSDGETSRERYSTSTYQGRPNIDTSLERQNWR